MKLTKKVLKEKLELHLKWLKNEEGGCRANLRGADLCDANLCGANLRRADLRDADLRRADLCDANLRDANLRRADLRDADLRRADLCDADLRGANLRRAYLCDADLRRAYLCDANLDYSCWPLWCGSMKVKVDLKISRQLAAHFCAIECDEPEYQEAKNAIIEFAKLSHRAQELDI